MIAPLPQAPSTQAQGLVEGQLRQAFAEAFAAALRDQLTRHNPKWIRDLLRALLGAAVRAEPRGGIGAAAVRASLVLALERSLPVEADCVADARVDAIYEGLALSPLGALSFTEATRRGSQRCVATAREAEVVASRRVLQTVTRSASPTISLLLRALEHAKRTCADESTELPPVTRSALERINATLSLVGARDAVVRLREATQSVRGEGSQLDTPCSAALALPAGAPTEAIDLLVLRGLGALPLTTLTSQRGVELLTCTRSACEAALEVIDALAEQRGPNKSQLTALVRELALPGTAERPNAELIAAAVRALDVAVVVLEDGRASIDPDVVLAELRRRYALLDGKPTLRPIAALPPSPWIVELNGGIPKLETGRIRIAGDVRLGYEVSRFAVLGRCAVRYFDFASSALATDNLDVTGNVDAWYVSGDSRSVLRVEGGLSSGLSYVDTTTLTHPTGTARTEFGDYDNLLLRGSVLVGLRGRAGDRFAFGAFGAGGLQYETFDSTSVDHSGLRFQSPDVVSGHGSLGLRARYNLVPAILSSRVAAEVAFFSLTREDLVVETGTPVTLTTSESQQLFTSGKLFVDADFASFAGFVPALFGRVEHVHVRTNSGDQATTIPVLGFGILRSPR